MNPLVSEWCGAKPWFSLTEAHGIYMTEYNTYVGVCGECKEHTVFQCEGDA